MKQTKGKSISKDLSSTNNKKTGWLEDHPVSFFLISLTFLIILFYIILQTDLFNRIVFDRIISINARLASLVLNLLGQNTTSFQGDIISSAVSVSVRHGCDALEPIALFVAAVISFPSKRNSKVKGVLFGITFLFLLNLVRIITLFFINKYYPDWFDFFHITVWQILFITLALGIFCLWAKGEIKVKADDRKK